MNRLYNRYITIKLILDQGKFPNTNSNTKTLTCNDGWNNCAAEVQIDKGGSGYSAVSCVAVIHNMNWDDCTAFSVMQLTSNWNLSKNVIEIYAANDDAPPLIFRGNVLEAILTPDNPESSNGAFVIKSLMGGIDLNDWSSATSMSGQKSIDSMLRYIISKSPLGYTPLISKKITGFIMSPIFQGNWQSQLSDLCKKFNLRYKIDVLKGNNVVFVAPHNEPFVDYIAPLSEENATNGFPKSGGYSVILDTWYDPRLVLGQLVDLRTMISTLQGTYLINGMSIVISNNNQQWNNKLTLIRNNR